MKDEKILKKINETKLNRFINIVLGISIAVFIILLMAFLVVTI